MSDTIKVFKDKADQWRWTKVASNGEPVATSEGYTTKASAIEAAYREADGNDDAQVEITYRETGGGSDG